MNKSYPDISISSRPGKPPRRDVLVSVRKIYGGDFHAARCVPTFIEITERTEIGRKFREYRLVSSNKNTIFAISIT